MPGVWLVVQEGPGTGAQHPVESAVTIGRDEGADVQLPDKTISRRHAALRIEGETAVVEDLGSRNGTFVNGTRVEDPQRLREGDSLQIGRDHPRGAQRARRDRPLPAPRHADRSAPRARRRPIGLDSRAA